MYYGVCMKKVIHMGCVTLELCAYIDVKGNTVSVQNMYSYSWKHNRSVGNWES